MKNLTMLFGAGVGVVIASFIMTIVTYVQEDAAKKSVVPSAIVTPALPR